MKAFVRTGCAGRVAVLISAGTAVCPAALAQSSVEVRTIVSVPPQAEPAPPPVPQAAVVPPWDLPQRAPHSAATAASNDLAAAHVSAGPSPSLSTDAFTGGASPLACRSGAYRAILDERTELHLATLCPLPDGTWQMVP